MPICTRANLHFNRGHGVHAGRGRSPRHGTGDRGNVPRDGHPDGRRNRLCSRLRVALARALLAVDRLWRPRAYAGEADIASFTAMLQAALSAVANPTALSAQQRQTALLPFAKTPNLLAATEPPAPPPRPHTCAGPDIDARTIHAVTLREIIDATGTYGSVDVHIELTRGGDVSSVSVAANHLRGDAGAAERIHAALEAAAESTFAPATRNCIAIPGGYIFAVEFAAPFGAHR